MRDDGDALRALFSPFPPQVISHYSAKVVDIKADRPAKEVEAAIAKSLA